MEAPNGSRLGAPGRGGQLRSIPKTVRRPVVHRRLAVRGGRFVSARTFGGAPVGGRPVLSAGGRGGAAETPTISLVPRSERAELAGRAAGAQQRLPSPLRLQLPVVAEQLLPERRQRGQRDQRHQRQRHEREQQHERHQRRSLAAPRDTRLAAQPGQSTFEASGQHTAERRRRQHHPHLIGGGQRGRVSGPESTVIFLR